ncbi:Zinc Finger Protein Rlf, partial [Manis pentadactyla]
TPVSPLLSVHYTFQSKRQYLVTGSPEKLRSTVTGLLWVTCSPLNQSPALQAI